MHVLRPDAPPGEDRESTRGQVYQLPERGPTVPRAGCPTRREDPCDPGIDQPLESAQRVGQDVEGPVEDDRDPSGLGHDVSEGSAIDFTSAVEHADHDSVDARCGKARDVSHEAVELRWRGEEVGARSDEHAQGEAGRLPHRGHEIVARSQSTHVQRLA